MSERNIEVKGEKCQFSVLSETLCFEGWRIDLAGFQVSIRSGTIRTWKNEGSNFEYLSLIQSVYIRLE